jgi:hypothetical protein
MSRGISLLCTRRGLGDSETCTGNAPDRGYLQDAHVRWYKNSGNHMEVIGESLLGS